MDELVIGSEYEIIEDLTLGIAYKNRRLGRVLEDISADEAETYVIGNPGTSPTRTRRICWRRSSLARGQRRARAGGDRLEAFQALRRFDTPRRDYHALELSAVKRVSRNFFVRAPTPTRAPRGTTPACSTPTTATSRPTPAPSTTWRAPGQPRRPAAQDRPHYSGSTPTTPSTSRRRAPCRPASGSRLLGHPRDPGRALPLQLQRVLPAAARQRRPDPLHHRRRSSLRFRAQAGARVRAHGVHRHHQLLQQEQVFVLDEAYTFDNANPIVDGTEEDLIWLRRAATTMGCRPTSRSSATSATAPAGRYTPLFIRFGARLTF